MQAKKTYFLNFRYRLYPNKTQQAELRIMLESMRQLYNCALEQRFCALRRGVRLNFMMQSRELTKARAEMPELRAQSSSAQQRVLRCLDATFKKSKRWPRFKSKERFRSVEFPIEPATLRSEPWE